LLEKSGHLFRFLNKNAGLLKLKIQNANFINKLFHWHKYCKRW
jgi:hypothetical protein